MSALNLLPNNALHATRETRALEHER